MIQKTEPFSPIVPQAMIDAGYRNARRERASVFHAIFESLGRSVESLWRRHETLGRRQ